MIPPLVLQTAGSLIAILALVGLAWWLKLGTEPLLDSDAAVRRAAGEVEDGFEPVAAIPAGQSAIARDSHGRVMVIRRHGNRFAGRVLGPAARARIDGDRLVVDPGEARFGTVSIALDDAQTWADAINRINSAQDA